MLSIVLHDNFDTHKNQINWYVCSTKCFKWIVSMLYKMSQLLHKQNHLLKKVKKVSRYVKKWKNDYDIYMFTFTQCFFHFELKSCIGFIFSQLREKFWEDLWIVVDKYIYNILKNLIKKNKIKYHISERCTAILIYWEFIHFFFELTRVKFSVSTNWLIMTLPIQIITSIFEVLTYIITALSMRLAAMLVLKSSFMII